MKLTLPQQDVYFEQQMYKEDPIYNIGAKIEIKGIISKEAFQKAYKVLIDQHDAYRIVLDHNKEEIEQRILEGHTSELGYFDFSTAIDPNVAALEFMHKEFRIPFDLDREQLLHKFILIKVDESFHYLFSVYHHLITDGWGTSLMFQRLVQNYNEIVQQGEVISTYPYSYKNFVLNDQDYEGSESFEKDKTYWKTRFENLPEQIFEKINKQETHHKSNRKELIIKRDTYNRLSQLAKDSKGSTFHVILGLLYVYFGRIYQRDELSIGIPVLNRSGADLKKTVGLFMGVSPLRMTLDFEGNFKELVQSIRQQLRNDYRHQRFPLGKLIKELRLFNEKERLFNITLSYEKQNYADHFEGTKTSVIPLTHGAERVALAVYIREFDENEDVKIDFDYNCNYFEENAMNRLITHFENLLQTVLKNPDHRLMDQEYLCDAEKEQLRIGFNQTYFEYDSSKTLLDHFKTQMQGAAHKIAVIDRFKYDTYIELDEKSDKIAASINGLSTINEKTPIAVLMERSSDLIEVLLGIMKSGRAYIPLDPEFPKERLEYIIHHSEVKVIIGSEELEEHLQTEATYITVTNILKTVGQPQPIENITASDTAYIIYTSGSTGNPKGVAISHKSLLNFLLSMKNRPGIVNQDTLFSVTTQSFDISILEFFLPLISGATLFVADKQMLNDPIKMVEELDAINPTIIQGTPSFYQMLYNAGWKGIKNTKIMCGGDLLPQALCQKMLDSCHTVWNMYGPTETTIWSSVKELKKAKQSSNIGQPIHNTQMYILDDQLRELPIGAPGAIYIGGDGLAQGYFKAKGLTDAKFIKNPFDSNQKIYDTGDVGKWIENGEIEFLGRSDFQVKVRGYRIELGDIENKLNKHESIKNSVVVAKKQDGQETYLVAYIISKTEKLDQEEIKEQLSKELPWYMIPSVIVSVEKFPLTPNKKVDRKQLIHLPLDHFSIFKTNSKPKTDLEKRLLRFYEEVLELKNDLRVSVTDNFFALGGHSLKAVRLIGVIDEQLRKRVTLKDVFQNQTVRELAAFVKNIKEITRGNIGLAVPAEDYPITKSQQNIWLASQIKERSIAYNMSAAFSVTGILKIDFLEKAVYHIINRHKILRTGFEEIGAEIRQKIQRFSDVQFKVDEIIVDQHTIKQKIEEYVSQEFDLESGILLKMGLFTSGQQEILVFVTHHIIMDGWSLENFIKELKEAYSHITLRKKMVSKNELPFQFNDFTVWQEKEIENSKFKNDTFWNNYLQNYRWKDLVTLDFEENEMKRLGQSYNFSLGTEVSKEIQKQVNQTGTSLYAILLSATMILLYREYENEDLCIGTVNSGRSYTSANDHLGMFVKTLPLRFQKKIGQSFGQLSNNVQQDLLILDAYQDIPDSVANELRLDVLVAIQNPTFDYDNFEIAKNLKLSKYPIQSRYSRIPLLFNFSVSDTDISCELLYDTSRYEEATLLLMTSKFSKILTQVILDFEVEIDQLDINLEIEKKPVLEIDFNF